MMTFTAIASIAALTASTQVKLKIIGGILTAAAPFAGAVCDYICQRKQRKESAR